LARLWDNLLKFEHHAGFKKTEPISLQKPRHSKYSFTLKSTIKTYSHKSALTYPNKPRIFLLRERKPA